MFYQSKHIDCNIFILANSTIKKVIDTEQKDNTLQHFFKNLFIEPTHCCDIPNANNLHIFDPNKYTLISTMKNIIFSKLKNEDLQKESTIKLVIVLAEISSNYETTINNIVANVLFNDEYTEAFSKTGKIIYQIFLDNQVMYFAQRHAFLKSMQVAH